MTDRWKKEGWTEIQRFEYLEKENTFLYEKKSFFLVFEGLSFVEKITNYALTNYV